MDHKLLFASFLSVKNKHLKDLNIPNILRLLEFVQLLKASQSGTEMAFNILSLVVEHKYQKKIF